MRTTTICWALFVLAIVSADPLESQDTQPRSVCGEVTARTQSLLVGAWERVALEGGFVTKPPVDRVSLTIYSHDGHWSQTSVPAGREHVEGPLEQMTKEQLVSLFQGVNARRGTYSVTGNKLTQRVIVDVRRNRWDQEFRSEIRFDGDVMFLTTPEGSVSLWQRAR